MPASRDSTRSKAYLLTTPYPRLIDDESLPNAFFCHRHHPDSRSQTTEGSSGSREGDREGLDVRVTTDGGRDGRGRHDQSDPFRAIDLKGFKTTEIGGNATKPE